MGQMMLRNIIESFSYPFELSKIARHFIILLNNFSKFMTEEALRYTFLKNILVKLRTKDTLHSASEEHFSVNFKMDFRFQDLLYDKTELCVVTPVNATQKCLLKYYYCVHTVT